MLPRLTCVMDQLMDRVSAGNLKITSPWLSSARNDLAFFFLPVLLALLLTTLFHHNAIANSPILSLLLLQGFGLAPFHQGVTWFHYFDRTNRTHYTVAKNIWWAIILPLAIVVLSTGCFFFSPPVFFFVFVLWTIQHIAKQNVGILLLYHNHDLNEAVVERDVEVGSVQTASAMFSFLFLNGVLKQDGPVAMAVHLVIFITAIELGYLLLRYGKSLVQQVREGKSLNAPALAFWALSILALAPFAFSKDYNQGLFVALVMHWFQYVGLNGILVSRKYSDQKNKQALAWQRPLLLFCAVGILYAVLAMPVDLLEGTGINPHSWQVRLVAGVVNGFTLAHYFLDAYIWRFREPFNRTSLLAYLKPRRKSSPTFAFVEEPELALR